MLFFYQDFGACGGIERYIEQVASWMQQSGLNDGRPVTALIVCHQGTPLYNALKKLGFQVEGVPLRSFFRNSIWRALDVTTWWRLSQIVRREKPDIAHVHIGLIENLWFRLWGLPVVYTVHGYGSLYSSRGVSSVPKRLFKAMTRWLFSQNAKRMDAMLFVSQAERERLHVEGYLPVSIQGQILPNGVPVAQLREQVAATDSRGLKEALGIPAEARCVSFINRLDANKNPADFLAVVRSLAQQEDLGLLHFLIAGDGPLFSAIAASVQLLNPELGRMGSRIHMLGHYSNIPALLSITDLLISTARREGFGLGVAEAMAVGVPCVAYASEGISTLMAPEPLHTLLVPVDDRVQLQQRVLQVLRQTVADRTVLSRQLRVRAEVFDQSFFVEKLASVYQRLCPLVSVILPVYQGEAHVLKAVYSVLNQTYPHLELIVVDDGSTDRTLAALASVRDERLRVFARANQGVAASRNFAFEQAQGEWIAFVDADDIWLPNKLATEVATIRRHATVSGHSQPAAIVYSGYYAVDEQTRLLHCPSLSTAEGDLSRRVLEDEGLFLPSTSLVHRDVFDAVGGFQTGCYHEDRVFFIAACRQFPVLATGKRLVLYQQSLSGRCRRVLANYDEALSAELSIDVTAERWLTPDEIGALHFIQKRNLLYRFLMYGYLDSARRLCHAIRAENGAASLFMGKKGWLAQLTLKSGVNFLLAARLIIQTLYVHLVTPFWLLALNLADWIEPVSSSAVTPEKPRRPEPIMTETAHADF